jgi:hypothetical protein
VSRDLLITSRFVGPPDQFALLEPGAGADQGDDIGGMLTGLSVLTGNDSVIGPPRRGGSWAGVAPPQVG